MSLIIKENDNVYLNVVFDHSLAMFTTNPNLPPTGEGSEIADYNVTKTLPIVDKASDFYLSVIRFDIPLNTIPIYIQKIIPNQPDPNLTPLIIGISYLGTNYSVYLEYIPNSPGLPTPVQNQPIQVITSYYFNYSYQNLIDMFNVALAKVWISSGLSATNPTVSTPFFFLDSSTQLINLVVGNIFVVTNPPIIYINYASINYLDGFQFGIFGTNQPYGKDFYFVLNQGLSPPGVIVPPQPSLPPTFDKYYTNPLLLQPSPPTAAVPYWQYTQDFSTLALWSSLRKIIISSNTIPVNNEFIPTGNNSTNQSGVSASFPIISDFVPIIESGGQSRSIAYYLPTAQYRLVDLISDMPVQKIDIKVFWEDIYGNLYPLEISVFQQASIKIAFLRKTLYKNFIPKSPSEYSPEVYRLPHRINYKY